MDISQSLTLNNLQAFRSSYEDNPMSRAATHAASKTSVEDFCYDTREAAKMNHKFSVDIPTMGACNQKSSGRCWIFASMNILREKAAKELNLESFELSQNYISFYDHLEKANTFLERIIETAGEPLTDRYVTMLLQHGIGDGGWWEYFVGLCSKYGVCPKEAMPETYQSSNTASMNKLLNMELHKDAMELRRELAAGSTCECVRCIKNQMLGRVYNILAICLGNPPVEFDFEYVDKDKTYHADRGLTPRAFYDKYIARDISSIVSILNAPTPEKPFYRSYVIEHEESVLGACPVRSLNLPLGEFKDAIIRQLQDGEPMWFSCDCHPFGCRDEGIWDTELYDYNTPFSLDLRMSKGDMLDSRLSGPNHAMLLCGVNLVDGKPDKWKIQNSWGDEKGDKGYFIMSDAWFNDYVYFACVDRKYLTDEQNRLFDQEPIVLPPWDTLA